MKSQYRKKELAGLLHCTLETHWLGGIFLMVYRNNAGRLGSGFISVCLETRWLGPKSGFYVQDKYCNPRLRKIGNEASSCLGIFSRTLRFCYVASSPGSCLDRLRNGVPLTLSV